MRKRKSKLSTKFKQGGLCKRETEVDRFFALKMRKIKYKKVDKLKYLPHVRKMIKIK